MAFARLARVTSGARIGTVLDQLDEQHVVVAFDDNQVGSLPAAGLAPYVPAPPPPDPTPTPEPSGSYNGFGPGAWPSSQWRPYADTSPFNQRAEGVAVHENSAAMISRVLSWGIGNLINGAGTSDFGHPTFYAKPTDPVFTLNPTGYSPAVKGLKIPVPVEAKWTASSDGHMTVVTPDGWEYDFWQVKSKTNGVLTFNLGGRTRIDGDGLASNATAARFGNMAGIIRAQELIEGRIDHALFLVVKGCASSPTKFAHGAKTDSSGKSAFVYPALAGCSPTSETDAPVSGTRFQLAMTDAQISALAIPVWKKTILRALATYGGYVGDTGGGGWGLQFESSLTYTAYGRADPLNAFAQQNKLSPYAGGYVFNVAAGVDWAKYLRVLVPSTP